MILTLLILPQRRRECSKVGAPSVQCHCFFLFLFDGPFGTYLLLLWSAPLPETVVVLLMLLLGVCGAIKPKEKIKKLVQKYNSIYSKQRWSLLTWTRIMRTTYIMMRQWSDAEEKRKQYKSCFTSACFTSVDFWLILWQKIPAPKNDLISLY